MNSNVNIKRLRQEIEMEENRTRPDLARLPVLHLELEKNIFGRGRFFGNRKVRTLGCKWATRTQKSFTVG